MTRHFDEDANAIVVQAYEQAVRLGHPYLGGEHLLLALAAAGQPAGAVLREHGVTPERAEAEIASRSGGGLFGDLDRDALATVGVDIDAVRATTRHVRAGAEYRDPPPPPGRLTRQPSPPGTVPHAGTPTPIPNGSWVPALS